MYPTRKQTSNKVLSDLANTVSQLFCYIRPVNEGKGRILLLRGTNLCFIAPPLYPRKYKRKASGGTPPSLEKYNRKLTLLSIYMECLGGL